MDQYLTICDKCVDDMKNVAYTSPMQFRGYFVTYKVPEDMICPKCKAKLRTTSMTIDDYKIIFAISHDTNFIQAMMDLKEQDIIEYQLKLSQFKSQVENKKQEREQAKIQKQIEDNTPRCPKCGSASVTSGARGVNWTWGIIGASKTVNRCGNCGHTWKPGR